MNGPGPGSSDSSDDLEALLAVVGDPRRWTWVLDFDGTLAPIVDRPDDARLAPGAWEAVAALAEVCEVALLSGRALDDLIARLGRIPAHVLLVGGHGSEARTPHGTHMALTDLDVAGEVLDDLVTTLAGVVHPDDGWLLERKSTSLAVHHRRVAAAEVVELGPRVREILEAAVGRGPGFVLVEGKAILEFKVRGVDKGRALAWIAEVAADRAIRLPASPRIHPLVFGDDVTDEDAFTASLAIDGEAVLIRQEPAATAARFRLHDPSRVVTLLRAARAGLGTRAVVGPGTRWEGTWDDRP